MYVSNPVVDPKICSRTSSTSYNKDIRFSIRHTLQPTGRNALFVWMVTMLNKQVKG